MTATRAEGPRRLRHKYARMISLDHHVGVILMLPDQKISSKAYLRPCA